ncbi:purine hydroxylase delta subunit apoprotein [Proteiniborus ethanoligenes]|uniref:Purine hydroxylase delta subunit apoprotein n=1 Tax=Proteiniborus ethanoligenes TaxID=415015 RepID=A0A1H3QZ69_9FIRM|nr:(2Fe-2S)-binding protein [Proteiniborus ethanoligenes]SDZ18650.1 purine hydroxylase delta subunit apoprotein [Proteiniborus ethanoligenes]
MEKVKISFNLNHKDVTIEVNPNKRLIDMLREDFRLLSVKEGCSEGECGACTVIVNGAAVTSCIVLAPQVDGSSVITLEGLSQNGELDKLQQSFIDAGAVQCGFCTPGMILSAKALLMKDPNPTKEEIKKAMSGNICRCTGYTKIIEAVEIARDK